jgi:RNA polymerase sigma-70 factor, ECF subfamily
MASEQQRPGPDEQELIQALRQGEPAAFALLQSRYLDRIFGYVRRRVGRHEDAEDIACDVFAAAAQSLPRFRGERGGLFVWLAGIARRKVADHLRRPWHRREVRQTDLQEHEPSPFAGAAWTVDFSEEFLHREEVGRAVRQAVEQLPAAQREAVLLRYVEGATLAEISILMRRSEDSVKALLRRARATLLVVLSPELAESSMPERGANHEEPHSHVCPAIREQ